jgi:uncharacterized protein YuzE
MLVARGVPQAATTRSCELCCYLMAKRSTTPSLIVGSAMKIRYFADTDTLLIEFKDLPVAETRDLDENTVMDVDAEGNICAITVEHASQRTNIPQFSYEQIPA